MLRRRLNLGILAHVDAGKTTLTERLLYAAGVIDELGSVDDGTTQTDFLALEQQRGITIKSAVASFAIRDVAVNLVDTPGHPDFIAEVERVLSVLDGVVLVVSAVEGVQAQTPLLMRALQRLRLPTLLFVNKVDRPGADCERVLGEIAARLTPAVVALGSVTGEGERSAAYTPSAPDDPAFLARLAELLAEHDDALLAAYVEDATPPSKRLRAALAEQTAAALVHPVVFGSALTGAGVDALTAAIADLLPAAAGGEDGPVSASVFKVERGAGGQKVAYVRVFSGTIRVRDVVRIGGEDAKVTAIALFDGGSAIPAPSVSAGQIAKLWGLAGVRIGDAIGIPAPRARERYSFGPPTLEAVVAPRDGGDQGELYLALTRLAEQDPLIRVRRDERRHELSVSLYGEVQKEVVEATIADEFGIEVDFRETTPIYVERPVGRGAAVEILGREPNPFPATIGLRVEPGRIGGGASFCVDVDVGSIPLYVYKSVEGFSDAIEETVRATLRQGLRGWEVTDCAVTVTQCGYSAPATTAGDFKKLTPLVLAEALKQAGTKVCEPIHRFRVEGRVELLPPALRVLARLRGDPKATNVSESSFVVEGEIAAARMQLLRRELGAATRGEGSLELEFARYEPVVGDVPTRPRSDYNPFDRGEYLLHLARRVGP